MSHSNQVVALIEGVAGVAAVVVAASAVVVEDSHPGESSFIPVQFGNLFAWFFAEVADVVISAAVKVQMKSALGIRLKWKATVSTLI